MAVNNLNPTAVPPTAAEIATAVAAPSAATIATSVAAAVPTRAQIQTDITNLGNAYNGPSAATIASTVAAPSSATIASAVLSAGNGAGWGTTGGETWTAISTVNTVGGVNFTYTFSSLSGYKMYRLVFANCGEAGTQQFNVQINGLASDYSFTVRSLTAATWATRGTSGNTSMPLNPTAASVTNRINGYLTFSQANLTGAKIIEGQFYASSYRWELLGAHNTLTAPITSIAFTAENNPFTVGQATLYGGN